jgi:hypothetical protein
MARITGVAMLDSGDAAPLVLVRDWDTFLHVAAAVPDADGSWAATVNDGRRYEVTVRGPAGYRPVVDGPISPEV